MLTGRGSPPRIAGASMRRRHRGPVTPKTRRAMPGRNCRPQQSRRHRRSAPRRDRCARPERCQLGRFRVYRGAARCPLSHATEGIMHIAFIGTGDMGLPMLANLLKKGFSATAYDIVPAALDRAVEQGAARAASPGEAAAAGEMVITILPSSGNVEAAYLGAGGILGGVATGRLCIDMSTIDPGTSTRVAARLAERGIRFIDAPVSGGVGGATAGARAIMCGGGASDYAEAKPALDAMGTNIIHVGAVGAGEVAKLCNNLIAGAAFVAVSEAFRIAEAFGVDPKILTAVIAKSSGATWVMERNHPVPGIDPNSAASRDYAPGFMTDLMAKELSLAVNAARDKRVPVSVAAAAQQIYRMASAHGLGRRDCAVVYRFLAPSKDEAPV